MPGEVNTQHPEYVKIAPDWNLIRDAMDGETVVKGKGEVYLPKPDGFNAQDDGGRKMYGTYLLRAKFPEILSFTIRGMVGIIHRVPSEVTLPDKLTPLLERATRDGLPLDALHERITTEILAMGRFGLLTDVPMEGDPIPYIAGYPAETLLNWSTDHDFFVLDETHLKRDGFEWKETPQYRVLEMAKEPDPEAEETAEDEDAVSVPPGQYYQVLHKQNESGELVEEEPVIPSARGGKGLEEIPFVVAGSTDVAVSIDEIPLLAVARCAFNIFRLDADYKWQLFMSGQETLFVFTDSTDWELEYVGAGVNYVLAANSDAKYVGPTGKGIESQKAAIEDERQQAIMAGARMFDSERKSAESGDALRIRWAAQTATLSTIAINSAKALEKALKFAALFVGANPDEVAVKPNLQFIDTKLDPLKAKAIMELWMGGAISAPTMWENFQRGDLATKERTWEEEKDLIDQEIADMPEPPPADPIPQNPDNPNPTEDSLSGQGQ